MKKIQNTLIGAAIALTSFQAAAVPFAGVDARSLGMGGTGVAAGSIVNASTFNPALLAAYREGEDFNFSVALGVLARDNGLIDEIDALQATNPAGNDLVTQFGVDVDAYNLAVNNAILAGNFLPADIQTATAIEAANLNASTSAITTALNNLNNKPIELGANVGVNLSIPSDTLGISVFVNSRAIAAGAINIDPSDTAAIDGVVTTLTGLTDFASYDNLNIADPFAGNLASTVTLTGGAVTESGVAFATKILGVAIGVTPKQLQIDTIETTSGVSGTDTGALLDDTGDTFTDANFDVGVAIDLGALKIGAVGKNMISQEYALTNSVAGSKVVIEPQLRAGIAFDAGWATLTMDQDLTVNKGIISNALIGDTQDSQYTSLGIEFDLSLVQIRAGMRSDNTGNTEDVFTAGIGLHALATVDFAVAGNDQGAEAVFQFGMRW